MEETDRQHKVLTEHLRIHAISAKLTGLLCRDLGARLGRPMDSGLGLPGHTVPSLITPGQGDMFTHRLRPLRREQPFTSQQARAGSGLNPAQVWTQKLTPWGATCLRAGGRGDRFLPSAHYSTNPGTQCQGEASKIRLKFHVHFSVPRQVKL